MKKILLTLTITLVTLSSFAQDFEKGDNFITLGFGVDPYGGYKSNNIFTGAAKKTAVGPIILMYERGVTDILGIGRIGAGGGIAQSFYTRSWSSSNYTYKESQSRTSIIFRAAYHFEFNVDKMDVYAGVGGAAHFYSETYKTDDPFGTYVAKTGSHLGGGHYVFGGIRYYFTPSFGVYAEAGHGVSALNGGLVFKF